MQTLWRWQQTNDAAEPWNLDVKRALYVHFDLRHWMVGVQWYHQEAGVAVIVAIGPLSFNGFYS